ncbi:MAG: type I restriction enzyme HsdR N-terminal domain-containing protein [Nitrospirota bacterium]
MSQYYHLGKIPTSPEHRKALLGEKIEMEEQAAGLQLTQVQRRVYDFLLSRKRYAAGDMELNKEFKLDLPDISFCVTADFVLKIGDRSCIVIKCVMSSMESWERHSIAFCRVVEPYQIPYAVVTDSEHARVLDAIDGKIIAEGMDAIPDKDEAVRLFKDATFTPYPAERAEREKRILFAFEAIKCAPNLIKPE